MPSLRVRRSQRSALGAPAALVIALVLCTAVLGLRAVPVALVDGSPLNAIHHRAPPSADSTCGPNATSPCLVSLIGSGWSLAPVASWCTTNTTSAPGPNGTETSSETYCSPGAGFELFNMTHDATLDGAISGSGPFAIWLIPPALGCERLYSIANVPVSCPPPFGPVPSFAWNASVSSARTLQLSDPSLGLGTIPAGSWMILLVDTGSAPESVTVSQSIELVWP